MNRYTYRVCQTQQARVTFVNGAWQGRVPLAEAARSEDPYDGCLEVWAYLAQAGDEGWRLVSATAFGADGAAGERLYLIRDL